jgi:hypothetical protein
MPLLISREGAFFWGEREMGGMDSGGGMGDADMDGRRKKFLKILRRHHGKSRTQSKEER